MKTNLRVLIACVLFAGACHGQAVVTTFAGTGVTGFSGDGGPATSARLGAGPGTGNILGVAAAAGGNVLIVDGGNRRIRQVSPTGIITTVAGGGGATTDGGLATAASIFPNSVAVDGAGNMYISAAANIRKVTSAGIISTIAGGAFPGYSGDGGPATAAMFFCTSVASDAAGNLYVADTTNQRIRKIDTNGIVTTVAGNGKQGYSGDGGPATSATLALPQGVAADNAGNIYFADNATHVRKVDSAGIITTVAGTGSPLGLGDGGPATSAGMTPTWVAVDNLGNFYIADTGARKIRKVNPSGVISTVAGGALDTGTGNGDGGPPTSAVFTNLSAVAVDAAGNVYIADPGADRIRKVSSGASASPVTVSPTALSFSVNAGAAAPPSQTLVIVSPGATLTFTAAASTTAGGNWLAVSPTNGNVATTLTVSINPAGLAAGTYNGTVTITPSGAGNTHQTVPVKLTVNPPLPRHHRRRRQWLRACGLSDGAAATSAAMAVSAVIDGRHHTYRGRHQQPHPQGESVRHRHVGGQRRRHRERWRNGNARLVLQSLRTGRRQFRQRTSPTAPTIACAR